MRRVGKWIGWIAAVVALLPIGLVLLVLAAANTGPGQRWIASMVPGLTGHTVEVQGLSGRFPDRLRAREVALTDVHGAYLRLSGVVLDWSPLRLLHKVFDASRLDVRGADYLRQPIAGKTSSGSGLPVRVVLHEFHVDRLTIAPAVAGQSYVVAAHGAGALDSYTAGQGTLDVQRLNGPGHYSVNAAIEPQRIRADIEANEPPGGLIAGLAGMPDIGAVQIDAHLHGPRSALATHVAISAGPLRANANGSVDLLHDAADLVVAADAPAMTPRPDVAWQSVQVSAHVQGSFSRPTATGQVRIAGLQAIGAAITSLAAQLSGDAGEAHVHAAIDGLTLPGQDPALFAGAPVTIDATARLDAPGRPVTFTLHHPLIDATGSARTSGLLQADVSLTLPRLEPVAKLGGTNLQGQTTLQLHVARHAATTDIALNGTLAVTGGQPQAAALLGNAAHLDLAAALTGHDAVLQRLSVRGQHMAVSAHGGLTNNVADLRWTLRLADLTAVEPTLAGQLDAQGQVTGPESDLTATANLSGEIGSQGVQSGPISVQVRAEGLPKTPRGTLTAQGALLGAPIDVALSVQQQDSGVHIAIQHAAWKSFHAGGALIVPKGARVPTGNLHVAMTRLADLQPLLGRPVSGSLDASVDANDAAAKIALTVQHAAVAGMAAVGSVVLNATVADPLHQPVLDAALELKQIAADGLAGSAKLTVRGPENGLALKLAVDAPSLSGAPARINAAATLDATARRLSVAVLNADWKRQPVHLLAPVQIDFANGLAIDHLRVGLHQAVLQLQGSISPTLDLTASLRSLPASLASVADPSLQASGSISAEARLKGALARPEGTVQLVASRLRVSNGPGAALPTADLIANVTLDGRSARIDTRMNAGASRLSVTGTAPLGAGALDLRSAGRIDLAMLDPLLAAEGRRVRGMLTLDATIRGTTAAPLIAGAARVSQGEADDFSQGVHISNIALDLRADGERLHLVRFSGQAGKGTLSGSGTIDMHPPMPVHLTFSADNATPISSDIVNARLDARLTVAGDVAGTLSVGGTVNVREANVQVPEKLPGSVVTLPVRDAHAPPPKPAPRRQATPTNVLLNITVDAPEQVFVRGRGLDVELGGQLHVAGTSADPQITGGLHMRRGKLSLAGQTLTFTSGSIGFTGAALSDPSINLVATSTAANVTATLTISGSARDPKIALSSVPPLPQDEILAALLFKQSASKLSPFQLAEMGSALASFSGGSSGIGDPLASLRKSLGLDTLSVGSTATGAPTLQAGRYVARGVYVGAQQSASGNGTQATVQVDLAKGLKLQTSAGTGSTTATGATSGGDSASIGLTYQMDY